MPGFKISPNVDSNVRPPSAIVYSYTWDVSALVGKNSADNGLLVYVRECGLPNFSIEEESVTTSIKYKMAKSISWDDIDLVFYDLNGTAKFLDQYKSKVWTESSGIRPAQEYQFNSIINVYDSTGKQEAKWTLNNSWIKSIKQSNLTYESSTPHVITATIVYDWATLS